MPFKSDRQRKAFFAGRNNSKASISPQVVGHNKIQSRYIKFGKFKGFKIKDIVTTEDGFVTTIKKNNKEFTLISKQPIQTTVFKNIKQEKENPKLTPAQSKFISKEIKIQIEEGRPQKQSIAIAFSKAREKFGNAKLKI